MQVSQLITYPIKSLGGISLQTAQITDRGLELDRRFMLVDEKGVFLTQRKFPEMALLAVNIEGNSLHVSHKGKDITSLEIPLPQHKAFPLDSYLEVEVWSDTVKAVSVSKACDQWFSEVLGSQIRLVYMPDGSQRPVNEKYARSNDLNSFSDGMPILIIGEESVQALNKLLEVPVSMNRFRPNIVFSGGLAYLEDVFREIKIGDSRFWGVKPCARCNVITINQETAEVGKEPLRTLSTYRRIGNKVLFGMNLLSEGHGEIAVGDTIQLIVEGSPVV